MKKLCGCKEPCFENGEAAWAYLGGVLCLHASEHPSGNGSVGVCGLDDKEVQYYGTATQYEAAQHCYKCVRNTPKWLMVCVKCKWFYDNGKSDESLEDMFKEEP